MSMTRKDFEAIAEIVREYKLQKNQHESVYELTTRLSHYFRQANSTFNKGKFFKACGYYQEG